MSYYHTSQFNLYLQDSNIPNAGMGVYTHETIPAHTKIDEYTGTLTRYTAGTYALELSDGLRIDARDFPRCYMGMINDCSYIKPQYKRKKGRNIDITPAAYYDKNHTPLQINCEFVIDAPNKKAYVYSIRDIVPCEELFVAYGKDYWKN